MDLLKKLMKKNSVSKSLFPSLGDQHPLIWTSFKLKKFNPIEGLMREACHRRTAHSKERGVKWQKKLKLILSYRFQQEKQILPHLLGLLLDSVDLILWNFVRHLM